MLPSKGYFRSIDCPFYKNNLCHRFYCHFRHNKKESSFSSDSETTDMINCEENSEICQDVLKDVIKKTTPGKENAEISHTTIVEKNEAANVNKEIDSTTAYSLPTDIPQYNPTPISELKTRHKQINRKTDGINSKNFSCNKLKNTGTGKDSNLIETLVGYFIENNSTFSNTAQTSKCEDTVTEVKSENKSISEKLHIPVCSTSIADSTSVENRSKEDTIPVSRINSIVQENMKLKEMISQLKNMESLDQSNKEILDNQTLLEDLMGTDSNIESNKLKKIVPKELTDVTFKKESYMNSEKHSRLYEPSHKKPKTKREKTDKKSYKHEISKRYDKTVRKSGQIKDCSQQILKNENCCDISGKVHDRVIKEERSDAISDTEVILISDSDDVDDSAIFDKSTKDKINDVSVDSDLDYLTEPKRKIRISRVKEQKQTEHVSNKQNSSSTQCADSPFSRSYVTSDINESENVYIVPKQKVRLAHKLNYNTLSVRSLQDHVSHWESVKERVKYKCINPGGEAGYQNWSKVKISPVPNVTSLINSKKMLYSKIHQWKSKAKF